jgi:RNA polymerase sigma-70 factor (ECF subfamily)
VGYPQTSIETRNRSNELAALIRQVADQNELAMAELYDSTSRLIYGLVSRIVADPATAEEVLIDIYMQAWRQADRYDPKRGAPLAWLTTIARSRALDRVRSGSQEQRRSEPLDAANQQASEESADEATFAGEVKAEVHKALELLSAEQREVIELAYYGGLSHSEIALELGQPLGTVKTRTRLGMIKLRETLKPLVAAGIL